MAVKGTHNEFPPAKVDEGVKLDRQATKRVELLASDDMHHLHLRISLLEPRGESLQVGPTCAQSSPENSKDAPAGHQWPPQLPAPIPL